MMKKYLFLFSLILPILNTPLEAVGESLLMGNEESTKLIVNNRVLAKVNGKPITLVDVMKKMDILFYREYPQYASSIKARYQFYKASLKHILNDLIDKELIISDAEENKLPLNNGDVRQEMEEMFGPNIIGKLDKAGLTFDEAFKIVQGDIKLKRMVYVRVNNPAMRRVSPKLVREAYEKFAKENILPPKWEYQVISIRDADPIRSADTANHIYHLLSEGAPVDKIQEILKQKHLLSKDTNVNVSEVYKQTEKEMSEANKKVLTSLNKGNFSHPIAQKSKANKMTVYRVFFLKDLDKGGALPFFEVENKLKDSLIGEEVNKEMEVYLAKLKKHFDVQEVSLEGYEPFSLYKN